MASMDEARKRYLLQHMAESGSLGRRQAEAEMAQQQPYVAALQQGVDPVAQTQQAAAAHAAAQQRASDAHLQALQTAIPLQRQQIDARYAAEERQAQREREAAMAPVVSEYEQRRTPLEGAIDRQMAARFGQRAVRQAATNRDAGIARLAREVGASPYASFQQNDAAVRRSTQFPTLEEQAQREQARRILSGEDIGLQLAKMQASAMSKPDALLAAQAGLNLSDDIGSRDPTIALAEVRSQPDYVAGRNQATVAAKEGVTPSDLDNELKAAGVGEVARQVIIAEYVQSLGERRYPAYDPSLG